MTQAQTPSRIPLPSTPARTPCTPRSATALGFGRFTPSLPLTRPKPTAPKLSYHTTNARSAIPRSPPSQATQPARPKSRLDSISSLVRSASLLRRHAPPPLPTHKTPSSKLSQKGPGDSPMSPPVQINLPSRVTCTATPRRPPIPNILRKDGPWYHVHLEWANHAGAGDLTPDQRKALSGAECLSIRDPFEEFNRRKSQILPPLPPSSIAMVPLAPPHSPTLPSSFELPIRPRQASSGDKPLPSAPKALPRKPVPPPSPSLLLDRPRPARLTGPRPMVHPSPFSRSPQSAVSTSPRTPPTPRIRGLASPSPPFARPMHEQVAGRITPGRAPWR